MSSMAAAEDDAVSGSYLDKRHGTNGVSSTLLKPALPDEPYDGTSTGVSSDSNIDDNGSAAGVAAADQPSSLLRSSISRGIDKLKDRSRSTPADSLIRRDSQDSGSSSGRRLSKLVPGVSSHRRRKSRSQTSPTRSLGGAAGASTATTVSPAVVVQQPRSSNNNNNNSSDSLPQPNSAASSLLTEDSEPESTSRPVLSSRPSHTGYLTLTSPLIASETVDSPVATSDSPRNFSHRPTSSPSPSASKAASAQDSSSHPPNPTSTPSKNSNLLRKLNVSATSRSDSLNIVETPSTLVTPPTPEQPQHPFVHDLPLSIPAADNIAPLKSDPASTAFHSFTHRRAKSASAAGSKLAFATPLTPAPEEVKTPGGSLVQPGTQPTSAGFFSSVFSATQNAVSSISNTFSTSPALGQKARFADTDKSATIGDEEVIVTNTNNNGSEPAVDPVKLEPAVATLGSGSLSLSHLGILETHPSMVGMDSRDDPRDTAGAGASVVPTPSPPPPRAASVAGDKKEDPLIVDTVATGHVSDSAPADKPGSIVTADQASVATRPKSLSSAVGSLQGDATPPRSMVNGIEGSTINRSGSVRSRVSDRRKRHRKNSSYSNPGPSTIASALVASHTALVNPASGRKPRPTGYATANQKRNKDFHQLFRSVPEDDYLIEDYSAALQREILLHGRLYVSERHICFSSNIMGWITNLVIGFDEVVALEKKNTAVIFPNAIVIQTLHAKNTFASLINREATYDLLLGIWRSGHPNLKATETGHALDNSTGDQNLANGEGTDDETDEDDDFDDDNEDGDENQGDENGAGSFMEGTGSMSGSDAAGDAPKIQNQRAVSQATAPPPTANGSVKGPGLATEAVAGAQDFPGPATHAPTECSDQESHYEKQCLDDTFAAPLGKVYSMMFGPLSGSVMRKFLEDQESTEIQYEDDKKGLGENSKSYSYSFIKKLNASIGPKQTKCIVNQTLDAFDLEKAVSVTCSTQTPDVPAGNAFVTKTKYCLTWGANNSTRLIMNSTTEWSGKSFLRGAIDKGAEVGQVQYGKDLSAFLKAQLASRSPTKGGRAKGKRKKKSSDSQDSEPRKGQASHAPAEKRGGALHGILEPLRSILGPLNDILGPTLSLSTVLGILLVLVTYLWLRQSYNLPNKPVVDRHGILTPQRLAAYEELWRREESELWNWLEDRISWDQVMSEDQHRGAAPQPTMQSRGVESRLDDARMSERQMDDAIRVTEQRLHSLKAAIERRKAARS